MLRRRHGVNDKVPEKDRGGNSYFESYKSGGK